MAIACTRLRDQRLTMVYGSGGDWRPRATRTMLDPYDANDLIQADVSEEGEVVLGVAQSAPITYRSRLVPSPPIA